MAARRIPPRSTPRDRMARPSDVLLRGKLMGAVECAVASYNAPHEMAEVRSCPLRAASRMINMGIARRPRAHRWRLELKQTVQRICSFSISFQS
jgi:hypothetical protein